jgi:hypothetical protein
VRGGAHPALWAPLPGGDGRMGLMGLMGLMGGAIERDALRVMGNLGEHAYRGLTPTAKIWRPYRAGEWEGNTHTVG